MDTTKIKEAFAEFVDGLAGQVNTATKASDGVPLYAPIPSTAGEFAKLDAPNDRVRSRPDFPVLTSVELVDGGLRVTGSNFQPTMQMQVMFGADLYPMIPCNVAEDRASIMGRYQFPNGGSWRVRVLTDNATPSDELIFEVPGT